MTPADTLQATLANIELFALMSPDVRALIAASCEQVSFAFGETIVAEGEPADSLLVIISGTARAVKRTDDGDEVPLGVVRAGEVLGEVALISSGLRTATVRASGAVEALRLDRGVFDGLVRTNAAVRTWAQRRAELLSIRNFLQLESSLGVLPARVVAQFAEIAERTTVAGGTVVVNEGEASGPMFVVMQGQLEVTRADGAEGVLVGVMRRGDMFGERSVVFGEPRLSTVRALSECVLLSFEAAAARAIVDEHPHVRQLLLDRARGYGRRRLAHVPLDFADALPEELHVRAAEDAAPAEPGEPGDDGDRQPVDGEPADAPASTTRIRRFPVVWQIDEMDCGAACLAAVCRHFGRQVPLSAVRQAVGTGLDGTSLRGLAAGAAVLGLRADAVKASKSRLDDLRLPAICHWQGNHWVVLYAVGKTHVRVSDPALGSRRIPRDQWCEHWSGYCCLIERTPALDEAPEQRRSWEWLRPFVRPHRRVLLGALVLALLGAALEMLVPVAAGRIVDSAIKHDRQQVNLLAIGTLALLLFAVAAALTQRWLLAGIAVRFDTASFDHLSGRLLGLPSAYFASRRSGDIERRLSGMRQARVYLVQQGVVGLTALAQFLVALVLMLIESPLLSAVYLATVPLYLIAMVYSRRRLRPVLASLEDGFGRYQSRQIDAIKGIETVKARGAERTLRRLLQAQFQSLTDLVYRSDLMFMRYEAAIGFVSFLTLALTVWVGGLLVLDGSLSIGRLVAVNGLVLLAGAPVVAILRVWDQLQYASVLLDRLDDVLDQEPEQGRDHSHLLPVPTLGGHVELRGVTVRTPEPGATTLLDDVTITAQPGETIAIVGRSGAGKTTLMRCLSGLVTPTSGRILYDGIDLATLDHRELRSRIGFVLQDDYLFNETIAANIALGEEQIDHDRVRWAARVADAAEFIERFSLGYETHVGESGLRLSGGQAQRIAIARAVYRQPPVLILDEATSALDSDSERAVKDAIGTLLQGRTAFVIAHRLSTIQDATRIVVLERGRIAEQGTHDQLLARRGIYWQLAGRGTNV